MSPPEILNDINGLPFVDLSFNGQKLLTYVAMVRKNIDDNNFELSRYLSPDIATALYQRHVIGAPSFPIHESLDDGQMAMFLEAKGNLKELIPEWNYLINLPINVHKLLTHEISLTNPLLPQQLFLNASAFNDLTDLEELLVHELSHIWSSFIAELYDFQLKNSSHDYVLPSGTGGKSPRGVLLACLFSIAAFNYHKRLLASGSHRGNSERIKILHSYFLKSLATLECSSELSEMGRLMTAHLKIASSISPNNNYKE